jgi:tetratricopeptide (TPR) repeat protein
MLPICKCAATVPAAGRMFLSPASSDVQMCMNPSFPMKPSSSKVLLTIAALLPLSTVFGAGPADELIVKGDAFYARLQSADALECYLPAEKLDPNNVRLLVHISREYRHLMGDASNPEEKRKLGGIALNYAKRAVALDANDAEAQLAVAISYGRLQPVETNREKIAALRVIKEAADRAIRLDPHSDLGWHVLGRWHKGIADVNALTRTMAQLVYGEVLPTSTYQEAAKCFEKAIVLNPNRPMHYIELGSVYAQMGRTDDAKRLINQGLGMRNTEKDDPETKRQGQEVLAQLH